MVLALLFGAFGMLYVRKFWLSVLAIVVAAVVALPTGGASGVLVWLGLGVWAGIEANRINKIPAVDVYIRR